MALPKLVISRVDFDAAKIADALKITPEEAVTALQDGRGAWLFSEIWGEHTLELSEGSARGGLLIRGGSVSNRR